MWNNGTTAASFTLSFTVYDASGAAVATGSGAGSVPGGNGVTIWNYTTPISLPGATLWHLVAPPAKPALYRLSTTLTIGGVAVDAQNVTFGVRQTQWVGATGFWLNGVNTKILGTANHQVRRGARAPACGRSDPGSAPH